MTNDISALIERARQAAGADAPAPSAADRQKLVRVAQEFESMLLVQVLKDMRAAGRWDQEDGEGEGEDQSGFGAESFFEMADTELANHLARVRGLGLSDQLLAAFDRLQPAGASATSSPAALPAAALPAAAADDGPALPAGPALLTPPPAARQKTVPPSAVPEAPAVAGSPTVRTVDGHVTSNFGWRRDPMTGETRFHRGVDLAAVYGQDVQAARSGDVVFSGEQRGYGNTVVVEHADGTRTRYAHLSANLVARGDTVEAGQPVGRAGHSGRATGTHVHFEVTAADGRPMAPDGWIKGI